MMGGRENGDKRKSGIHGENLGWGGALDSRLPQQMPEVRSPLEPLPELQAEGTRPDGHDVG